MQRDRDKPQGMSETIDTDRDGKTGRFVAGNAGNGGRKPGTKNKITEQFLRMFSADVAEHGADVIERVRIEQPGVYLEIWADLLPRETRLDVDVTMLHDVTDMLTAFQVASDLLGADPRAGMRRLRKIAPELERYDVAAE